MANDPVLGGIEKGKANSVDLSSAHSPKHDDLGSVLLNNNLGKPEGFSGFGSDRTSGDVLLQSVSLDSDLDPNKKLASLAEDKIGNTTELGFRDGRYVDSFSAVFAVTDISGINHASDYICTFAGGIQETDKRFDHSSELKGPEEVKAYCVQIAMGADYREVHIIPERRSQAEEIHNVAVAAANEGLHVPQIEDCVLGFARKLGLKVI